MKKTPSQPPASKRPLWLTLVVFTLVSLYAGNLAWRAHKDLVTLEVREMDIHQVAKKLRWQTWEQIIVHKDMVGSVTLNVQDQPLEVVLGILNDQLEGRWATVYPLYTTRKSLSTVKALAVGDRQPPAAGWSNWNPRPFGFGPGSQPPAGNAPSGVRGGGGPGFQMPFMREFAQALFTNLPPVDLSNKTPQEITSIVRSETNTRIIPEDGTVGRVSLKSDPKNLDGLVDELATKVNRNWTRLYVLEPRRGFRPPGNNENGPSFARNGPDGSDRRRPGGPEGRPPGGGPPPEMQSMMQALSADPAVQQAGNARMLSGLKNSTPSQRADRDKQRLARRQRMQNR